MTIQYQNTLEEYLEATRAIAARKKKRARRSFALTIVMAVYFLLIGFLPGAFSAANRSVLMFQLYAPLILVATEVVVLLAVMSLLAGRLPRIGWWGLLSIGSFVVLIVILIANFEISRALNPKSSGSDWNWQLIVPHITWLFFVAVMVVLTVNQQRKRRQTKWDQQPTLHRAKSADITADGVAITDVATRHDYRWEAFVGWTETKSLFVLFISEFTVLFFPKCAFASAEELDAMRVLAGLIPTTTSTAFQVVSTSLPPPLPEASAAGSISDASKR